MPRVFEVCDKSVYELTNLSEPMENLALSNVSLKLVHEHRRVSRCDREPSTIPI